MSFVKVKLIGSIIVLGCMLMVAVKSNATLEISSTEAFDAYVMVQMDKANIPGLSIGIVKDDQIIYLKGYGKADETNRPVTPQTPFIIGSITKSFTALAIRQLVNEGKIDLDKPVTDYIPWFRLADAEASRKITIRNLEEHKSGISTDASYEYELYHDRYSLVQIVEMYARVKPSKPAGVSFQYSNINYSILGLVIQTVTGMPYEEYVKKHIFDPLQMQNSFCSESEASDHGLAKGYQLYFGLLRPRHVPFSKALLPAGNMLISAEDMAHYMITFLNNGRYNDKDVTWRSNELNHSAQADDDTIGLNYNMDWNPFHWYEYSGNPEYAGGAFNYSSDMLLLPKGKWGVIVLANTNSGTLANTTIGPISIANGIAKQFLAPQEYQPASNEINKVYLILDLIFLMIILLIAAQIRNLAKNRNRISLSRGRLVKFIGVMTVVNFALPMIILIGLPRLINHQHPSWATVTLFMPDIGWFSFISSVLLLLAIGIIKVILLVIALQISRYRFDPLMQTKGHNL